MLDSGRMLIVLILAFSMKPTLMLDGLTQVLKTEVVTEPQPETVEIFDPFLGETYLKTKPAPVTHLDSLPPMRMAHEPELTHDLFDPFF